MRYSRLTQDLAPLAGDKWALHLEALRRRRAGEPILMLTIGEPDQPAEPSLIAAAKSALDAGRTRYSNGHGEPGLLDALVQRYQPRSPTPLSADNFLCLPGTQTALYVALRAILEPGDEVLVGDPLYATYQAVIAACGARPVFLPTTAESGFLPTAEAAEQAVTPRTKALLLNSPHNPSGTVMSASLMRALGDIAQRHDLWIVADEVYEALIFEPAQTPFVSPWDWPDLQERSLLVSSISKSHAAPGFRSGWIMASTETCARALPIAEAMLFGNQPFLADATAVALAEPSQVADRMRADYARRARLVEGLLERHRGLKVFAPQAGMFILVEVAALGLDGSAFARRLLEEQGVAVMPGASFGTQLAGWLRLSLTVDDSVIAEACRRIVALVRGLGADAAPQRPATA